MAKNEIDYFLSAIFVCVDWSNAELRNVREFNHIKEKINLQIQDRLRGKTNTFDLEYHSSILNSMLDTTGQTKHIHTFITYRWVAARG